MAPAKTSDRRPQGHQDIGALVDDVIFKENPKLRAKIEKEPQYRQLLEDITAQVYHDYKGPIYWGRVIDRWDRVTSAAGLAADVFAPGAGTVLSGMEEGLELIPKAAYGAYYLYKTGDVKAIPYWLANEAFSLLPIVGDLWDMKDIYLNRARKRFALAVGKRFSKEMDNRRPPVMK